jgi:uncharacterized protein (TIGR02246 family)
LDGVLSPFCVDAWCVSAQQHTCPINREGAPMKQPFLNSLFVYCLMLAVVTASFAQETPASDGRVAIGQAVQAYVRAYNNHDARALAALWLPDGVYMNQSSGEQVAGREALERDFAAHFARWPDAQLEVYTESVEFVSPNVAVEQGKAVVLLGENEPIQSRYSVVYIESGGRWLIDRVSEEREAPGPQSNYDHLKQLEWMIGDWVDREGGEVVRTECQWSRNKNFLVRAFSVSIEGELELSGMQLVGWDAARKEIRSWVFDSEGGFAEGEWLPVDDRWLVKTTATLPGGGVASSTSVLEPLDDNSFSWQKVNRVVDGEILPNIAEIIIVRETVR